MEDFDEDLQAPDDSGAICISHRGWASLDAQLFTWAPSLLKLDISYNEISTFPAEIGTLAFLRELNAACNALVYLPPEIGGCSRLRKLKLNGNRLQALPNELAKCQMLEELHVGENYLTTLPKSLCTLPKLTTVLASNNRLEHVPLELANADELTDLDLSNNPDLEMIPDEAKRNAKLIKWVCSRNQEHEAALRELVDANQELEMLAKSQDDRKLELKDEMARLRKERQAMLREWPGNYMKMKKSIKSAGSAVCTIQ